MVSGGVIMKKQVLPVLLLICFLSLSYGQTKAPTPKPSPSPRPRQVTKTEQPAAKPKPPPAPQGDSKAVLSAFNKLLDGIRHANVNEVTSVYQNSPRLSLFNYRSEEHTSELQSR